MMKRNGTRALSGELKQIVFFFWGGFIVVPGSKSPTQWGNLPSTLRHQKQQKRKHLDNRAGQRWRNGRKRRLRVHGIVCPVCASREASDFFFWTPCRCSFHRRAIATTRLLYFSVCR
jgi:hypothetical protein